jgi:hypothetical protein
LVAIFAVCWGVCRWESRLRRIREWEVRLWTSNRGIGCGAASRPRKIRVPESFSCDFTQRVYEAGECVWRVYLIALPVDSFTWRTTTSDDCASAFPAVGNSRRPISARPPHDLECLRDPSRKSWRPCQSADWRRYEVKYIRWESLSRGIAREKKVIDQYLSIVTIIAWHEKTLVVSFVEIGKRPTLHLPIQRCIPLS